MGCILGYSTLFSMLLHITHFAKICILVLILKNIKCTVKWWAVFGHFEIQSMKNLYCSTINISIRFWSQTSGWWILHSNTWPHQPANKNPCYCEKCLIFQPEASPLNVSPDVRTELWTSADVRLSLSFTYVRLPRHVWEINNSPPSPSSLLSVLSLFLCNTSQKNDPPSITTATLLLD